MKTNANDRTPLYKGVTRVAGDWLAAAEYGYEMDCLISEEFTPAMEYSWLNERVEQLLARYGATLEDYMQWLTDMVCRSYNPYGTTHYEVLLGILQYSIEEADERLTHKLLH
jgi:hypothetical protein